MSITWALLAGVVAAGAAVTFTVPVLRRRRRVRRLAESEASVAKSVADGRLSRATGEVLLQHLEGLRRESSGNNGS